MKIMFQCPKCKVEWSFPDLTIEQVIMERRNRCPRCSHTGEPVTVTKPSLTERIYGWFKK